MNNSFEYIDIILLAMIAGFIFLRLRGILGRKSGFEEKVPTNFETNFPKEIFAFCSFQWKSLRTKVAKDDFKRTFETDFGHSADSCVSYSNFADPFGAGVRCGSVPPGVSCSSFAGEKTEKIHKGRIWGASMDIWRVLGEILPLQNSKEKLTKHKGNTNKKQLKHIFPYVFVKRQKTTGYKFWDLYFNMFCFYVFFVVQLFL